MAPPVQFSGNDINALLSSLLTKKGGSDFSSMSVDPVMQYLNGNWQQNPRFTLNELYARYAPTFSSLQSLPDDNPHKVAAARIKEGVPYWQVVNASDLQPDSGMDPKSWSDFVDKLMAEQKAVNAEAMDQDTTQDYFEKQGMHSARDSWTDRNTDGSLKFGADAQQFAPQQFADLTKNYSSEVANDAARRQSINSEYGSRVMETDRDKILQMLYSESLGKRNRKENERIKGKRVTSIDPVTGKKVVKWEGPKRRGSGDDLSYVDGRSIDWFNDSGITGVSRRPDVAKQMVRSLLGLKGSQWFGLKPLVDRLSTSIGANNPRDQRAFAMLDAKKLLEKVGSAGMEDKRLSAIGRSDANAINAYMDRKQGSAVNTQRQTADLAKQVLLSLQKQGSTPLNNDILRNVIMRQSTQGG